MQRNLSVCLKAGLETNTARFFRILALDHTSMLIYELPNPTLFYFSDLTAKHWVTTSHKGLDFAQLKCNLLRWLP